MDKFDDFLREKPKAAPRKKTSNDLVWNLLTALMLLLTVGACIFFFGLISNPQSNLNPFAANTLVPPPPTATWTPIGFEATWTPTITPAPTNTNTPRPTYTIEPSLTPYKVMTSTPIASPTKIVTPTRTIRPTGAPYSISVTYNDSTTFQTDSSCASMYVAGQTVDFQNKPVIGLFVKLGGRLPGKTYLPPLTTLTGINKIYGQSGFEFDLGVAPVASTQTLWVQLYDQSDAPLSEQFKLPTFTDCKKNLILVRFQQK